MKKPEQADTGRREFLNTAKSAGLLGAALALLSRTTPAAPMEETQAPSAPEQPQQRGYQETEHVRKYYAKLRRM
jgi:hypothetical protein